MNLFPELKNDYYITPTMKAVWKKELEIALAIKSICEKHGIHFCLIGGSLLGAIRHDGFIPWDDDIDIGMKRSDYELFLQTAQKELPKNLFVQTSLSDPGRNIEYCQIRNKETTAIDMKYINDSSFFPQYNLGIFIDVFPLDFVNPKKLKIQKIKTLFYQHVYAARFISKKGIRRKIERIMLSPIFNIIGKERFFDKRKKVFSLKNETNLIGLNSFLIGEKRFIWKKEWFDDYENHIFEGENFPIPIGYVEILNNSYGNWNVPVKGTQMHSGIYFDPYNSYLLWNQYREMNTQIECISMDFSIFKIRMISGNDFDFSLFSNSFIRKLFVDYSKLDFEKKLKSFRTETDNTSNPISHYWIFNEKNLIGYFKIEWKIQPIVSYISVYFDKNESDRFDFKVIDSFIKSSGISNYRIMKQLI